MLVYLAEDGLQSDSSSDDDDAASDSQPESMQAVQHLHNVYSQPLGEHPQCGSINLLLLYSIWAQPTVPVGVAQPVVPVLSDDPPGLQYKYIGTRLVAMCLTSGCCRD